MKTSHYKDPTDQSSSPPTLPVNQDLEIDQIRKNHINTESTIKFNGFIYMIIGVLGLLIGIDRFTSGMFKIVISLGFLTLSIGLLRLNKNARITAAILSLVWVALILTHSFDWLFTTILLLPNAAFSFALFGKKGRFVTTTDYKDIIVKTPHVKIKTSIGAWVLFAIIFALIIRLIF
ncbi:hypothetical protein N9Z55_07560 [Akkermansiaceae bacterium]|nr:hypothetical protein [Akkermansiaceae bacterium]MDB4355737.1 hypothetical protein [Akkermansiaceae bacterium]